MSEMTTVCVDDDLELPVQQVRLSGPPLEKRSSADYFELGDAFVAKLFHKNVDNEEVAKEAQLTWLAEQAGVRVAKAESALVEDLLTGRLGVQFERIDAPTLLALMETRPRRVLEYSRLQAKLQLELHARQAGPDWPCLIEKMCKRIRKARLLAVRMRRRVIDLAESLPPGDRICHGDLHAGNVLMPDSGPVVIDWLDATRGNPMADVARSSLLMGSSIQFNMIYRAFARIAGSAYLRAYRRESDWDDGEFLAWTVVNAAFRLEENISNREKGALVGVVNKQLDRAEQWR